MKPHTLILMAVAAGAIYLLLRPRSTGAASSAGATEGSAPLPGSTPGTGAGVDDGLPWPWGNSPFGNAPDYLLAALSARPEFAGLPRSALA